MKKFIVLFLGILLTSCEMSQKPKNLLNQDKMAEILADLAIYEQTFSANPNYNPQHTSLYVFKKHKIQQKDFEKSYAYYIENPSELNKVYDKAKKIILDKDPKMNDHLNKKHEEAKSQK